MRSHIDTALAVFLFVACSFGTAFAKADVFTVGVGTHFAQLKTSELEVSRWLSSARSIVIRDEIYWDSVQSKDGLMSLPRRSAPLLRAVALADSNGSAGSSGSLLVLSYGHPTISPGQPINDYQRDAFAKYASFVGRETAGVFRRFEIWNEWNLKADGGFRNSKGSALEYRDLLYTVLPALKSVRPDAELIVGAVGDDPSWQWVRELSAVGGLRGADAISVHLYNHCETKLAGAIEVLSRLDQLRALLVKSDLAHLKIYVTEFGWPVGRMKCGYDEGVSSLYSIRALLGFSARAWVGGAWVYEFRDNPQEIDNFEGGFGLISRDGKERVFSCFLRANAAVISGRPILQREFAFGSMFVFSYGSERYVYYLGRPFSPIPILNLNGRRFVAGDSSCERVSAGSGGEFFVRFRLPPDGDIGLVYPSARSVPNPL